MSIQSINPATGELIYTVPYISMDELSIKQEVAHTAYQTWKHTPIEERIPLFISLADILENRKDELALLDTVEMGMPITEALGDITKSIANIRYFIKNASVMLQDQPFDEDGIQGRIIYEPMGTIYSIAPWNYPMNQVIRSTVPNIISGNVVLVKHASNVPQMAMALEQVFADAGFPLGIYTNLSIPSTYSESIISDVRTIGVTITGGDRAGRAIGALAGKYLKPSILELGGSDPFLVIDTDNLAYVVEQAIKGRMSNNGQKCNSSKRCIVLDRYYDQFCELFVEGMNALIVGDPQSPQTQVGPLAKEEMIEELDTMVQQSISQGARLLKGGKALNRPGFFYEPTVLSEVRPGMSVFDEEVFGPVAPIIRAHSLDDMISLANMSRFGLGCSIFGKNKNELDYLAERIDCANITINGIVTSYPSLPYGGIKESGYGKELGIRGIRAFLNEKVIIVK